MSSSEHGRDPQRDPRGGILAYPPPQVPHGYGHPQWELRARRADPIETKPFFLTSEFVVAALAIAGIAITAASSDAFGAWRAWILISAVTIGYIISRGIAKSRTGSRADDSREQVDRAPVRRFSRARG